MTSSPPHSSSPSPRARTAPGPRRSIRARILGAFVLSLAAWVVALGYTLVQLQDVGHGIAVLDSGYLPLADSAARLEAAARQLDREQERPTRDTPRPVSGARTRAALYRANLDEVAHDGLVVAQSAADSARDPADAAAFQIALRALTTVSAQAQAYEEAVAGWVQAATYAASSDSPAAATEEARAQAELALLRTQLIGTTADLSALIEGRIQRVSERTAAAQRRALAVGGGAGMLAITLAGLMAGAALVTLQPIAQLTRQVQRLAAGEEAGRVELKTEDEVGVLAHEFNAMVDAVAERDRRLSERAAALDRLSLRLRQILDTIHSGLVVVEGGRAGIINPAATELWGLRVGDLLPASLSALGPGRHEQLRMADGCLLDVEVVPFGDTGSLVVGEDVTQRVHDRDRLARTERLALVGQMLAQITHEVRNPLNAMSLHAELLAEEVEDRPEAAAMLDTVSTEIARLEQVTARYLDLSRRQVPELCPENPTDLVRGVLRTDEEVWHRAGAVVTLKGQVDGVVDIAGDTLRRAVRNVVRNAVEAGASAVTLLVAADADAGRVVLTVQDNGPGITPDDLKRVFDPFFTTKVTGTGLGLAISRQELEEAGGALIASSQAGGGSTFRLELPYREISDEPT